MKSTANINVEWTEVRQGETFRIDATKTSAGWSFRDKSIWESKWYEIKNPTADLAAKAEKQLASITEICQMSPSQSFVTALSRRALQIAL